jgi:amino acid permease
MVAPQQQTTPPPQLTPAQITAQREQERQQRKFIIIAGVVLLAIVIFLAGAAYMLFRPATPAEDVGRIRDIFLIFMALESLVVGVALIVLIVQLASLINLLQNEVRPILHATSETVNTLRGTVEFLGENVVEPVVKLNGYLAGLRRMLELLGIKPK